MFIRSLFFSAIAVCSLSSIAQTQTQGIDSISLSYTIKLVGSKLGNATVGRLETTLTRYNNNYTSQSTTKAQGLAAILMGGDIHLNCEFRTEPGLALSQKYAGGNKKADKFQVTYDWDTRKIIFSDGESLDMPPGYITDTCNMPFVVALLNEDHLSENVLYVLEGSEKRIRGYRHKSSNPETLETPLGAMETIKVTFEREFKPERTLSFWLSLEHDHVPIKIEDARSSRTITTLVNTIEPS